MLMSREPEYWQELHSPTVLVENVVSHQGRGRTKEAYRQRQTDHRLITSLTQDELRAWHEIDLARTLIVSGMTARAQRYERADRSYDGEEGLRTYQVMLLKQFGDWSRLVLGHEVMDYNAAIAIISEGYGPAKVDTQRRRSHGWARRNLGLVLGLWCDLRGWA